MININFKVNGEDRSVEVDENLRLLDLLRDELKLTGTKEGCGEGECGACTVIMDGETVNSCMVMAFQAEGSEIVTIEGLEKDGQLDPVQQAYLDVGAVQCGFCIPGMVLSTKALLDKNEDPTEEEIKEGLSGNLCRCTGYSKMSKATQIAKEYREEEAK